MAKPPIIISNGGVVGFLAQGINDPRAEQKIMNNLAQLNENAVREEVPYPLANWIIRKNIKIPMIFWYLNTDNMEEQIENLKTREKDNDVQLGDPILDVPPPVENK